MNSHRLSILAAALAGALLLAGSGAAVRAEFPDYAALRERAARRWTSANPAAGKYLVLLPAGSPLRKAADALAAYRKAEIVAFDPARPEDVLEILIGKQPRWAAVFVEPKDMDVNLVRRMIVLSTMMDEDPFCDFAFGFITGATPQEAEAFVARILKADRQGVEPRTAQFMMSNTNLHYAASSFLPGLPGEAWYVNAGDKPYALDALKDLSGAGFVHLGGCGDPESIWMFDDHRNLDPTKHWPFDPKKVGQDPKGEMTRLLAADVRGLKLDGAVVWTHVCHIGSVDRMWVEGDIVSTFGSSDEIEEYRIPKGRSMALAILAAGASAYMAPLGPNFGMQSNVEQAWASELGLPLGDVMRRGYHDIVMDSEGHPEGIGLFRPKMPAHSNPDAFVNHNSPHNRCLYGDPRLAPLGGHRSPATVTTQVAGKGEDLTLTFRLQADGMLGRVWYGNRGRQEPGHRRIYETVELAQPAQSVELLEVRTRDAAGKPFTVTKKTALLEQVDGRTVLHVQVVTDNEEALSKSGAEVEVKVRCRPRTVSSGAKNAAAPAAAPPYVILTNLAEKDPWFAAATELRKAHPDAHTVRFTGQEVQEAAAELAALAPDFVAVVLRPEDIDIHLQGRLLEVCTRIDDDPFCDFAFGYVTGATPAEAKAFAETIVAAGKAPQPKKMLQTPTSGQASVRYEGTGAQDFGVDWPKVALYFGEEGGKPMTPEQARDHLKAHLADFRGNGAILTGGHGAPPGIHGNLSGRGLREVKPDLFPAVVYNYACFTGCVGRAFQWAESREEAGQIVPKTVPPEESIALAFLACRVPAYIASIEPRPAGPGMGAELLWALHSGESLGEVRKREYDMLVLGFLSWGEKGLVLPQYAPGPRPSTARGAVRDIMMMDACGAVLYGDPAWRPFERGTDLIETKWTADNGAQRLEAVLRTGSDSFAFDPYRDWGGRQLASRLYAVADLPAGMDRVGSVRVLSVQGADGKPVEYRHLTWAVEKTHGRLRLHVKVNGAPDALTGVGVRATFRVSPDVEVGVPEDAVSDQAEPDARDTRPETARTHESPGESSVEQELAGSWYLELRTWNLGELMAYLERIQEAYRPHSGRDKVQFLFDDAARALLAERSVTAECQSRPLQEFLDTVCAQTGLTYAVEPKTNSLRFTAAPGKR